MPVRLQHLPKLGWLGYRNSREVLGTVKNIALSQSCGKWYASIQTEREVEQPIPQGDAVGIDMGIARFATLSDGTFYVLPRDRTFVHGRAEPAAFVELKLPAVALAAPDKQRQFVERATAIVLHRAGGRLTPAQIRVNVVHAVDGGWGIAGRRYDNASLVDSIKAAAATQ